MLKWRRTYTWQRYSNRTSCIPTDVIWIILKTIWRRLQLCQFVINCHLCLCLWLSKHRKGRTTTQTRKHFASFTPTIALFSLSLRPSEAYILHTICPHCTISIAVVRLQLCRFAWPLWMWSNLKLGDDSLDKPDWHQFRKRCNARSTLRKHWRKSTLTTELNSIRCVFTFFGGKRVVPCASCQMQNTHPNETKPNVTNLFSARHFSYSMAFFHSFYFGTNECLCAISNWFTLNSSTYRKKEWEWDGRYSLS